MYSTFSISSNSMDTSKKRKIIGTSTITDTYSSCPVYYIKNVIEYVDHIDESSKGQYDMNELLNDMKVLKRRLKQKTKALKAAKQYSDIEHKFNSNKQNIVLGNFSGPDWKSGKYAICITGYSDVTYRPDFDDFRFKLDDFDYKYPQEEQEQYGFLAHYLHKHYDCMPGSYDKLDDYGLEIEESEDYDGDHESMQMDTIAIGTATYKHIDIPLDDKLNCDMLSETKTGYLDVFELRGGIIYNSFTKEKVDQLPTEQEYHVFKIL